MSSLHIRPTIFIQVWLLAVKGQKLVDKKVVKVRGLHVPTLKVQLHEVNSYGEDELSGRH